MARPKRGQTDGMGGPFVVGRHYRVKASFDALRDRFEEGEILVYDSSVWSRYDGITGYLFTQAGTPGRRVLDIYDSEPDEPWTERLEPIDVPGS